MEPAGRKQRRGQSVKIHHISNSLYDLCVNIIHPTRCYMCSLMARPVRGSTYIYVRNSNFRDPWNSSLWIVVLSLARQTAQQSLLHSLQGPCTYKLSIIHKKWDSKGVHSTFGDRLCAKCNWCLDVSPRQNSLQNRFAYWCAPYNRLNAVINVSKESVSANRITAMSINITKIPIASCLRGLQKHFRNLLQPLFQPPALVNVCRACWGCGITVLELAHLHAIDFFSPHRTYPNNKIPRLNNNISRTSFTILT